MTVSNVIPEATIWTAMERRIEAAGHDPVLSGGGVDWTASDLREAANMVAGRLAARGIRHRSCVMTMLPNSVDHALLVLAFAHLGAVWAAIAPDQRGPALDHIFKTVKPDLIIAAPSAVKALKDIGVPGQSHVTFDPDKASLADSICGSAAPKPTHKADPDDVRALVFTSGTTGPPKCTQVTERMLIASAWGAAHALDAVPDDRLLLWEPLYHIGGSQLLVLSLLLPVRLFVVPRFSASRFWDQARKHGITKLHYLGGVLEILLAQSPHPRDTDHKIRLAFGAGARPDVWRAFQQRFQIPLREVYGLTEASSFTTINNDGLIGSIGKPLPWIDVSLVDEQGSEVPDGQVGEIVVRTKVAGLLTPGYLDDPEATARLLRGGTLYTGDLARSDGHGGFSFIGRKKDAIRCRGELVSAWEVESALLAHPDIAECAAVAVPAEIGEEEILVFVRAINDARDGPASLARWAVKALPRRSCPRYWKIVEDFPRTPSARIAKTELCRDIGSAYDARINA